MLAIQDLNTLYTSCTPELTVINGQPAIELVQEIDAGERIIRGRLGEDAELETISTKYIDGAPKWTLSKAEKAYLLQLARQNLLDDGGNIDGWNVELPREGQYFSIEGHYNFAKQVHRVGAEEILLACGTGNNTYYRRYVGKFFEVRYQNATHIFLYGERQRLSEWNGSHESKTTGLQSIYSISDYSRYYHTYR